MRHGPPWHHGYVTERRTIFITGATDGLGKALAHRLAADGADLILHGRDPDRLDRTAEEVREAYGVARPRTVLADLAELAQVRRLAADVRDTTDRLDVFVSNAGIGTGEPDGRDRRTSVDGHELRFAVNYLAGFLLTLELLPLLRRSAPARIVYVASIGQQPIDFDDLMIERDYSGVRAYCQSKLAQIMHAFDLAEAGVTANALHPATFMPTKMVVDAGIDPLSSLEQGLAATLALVQRTDVSGRYFNGLQEARADTQAYDADARARLRAFSEEYLGANS